MQETLTQDKGSSFFESTSTASEYVYQLVHRYGAQSVTSQLPLPGIKLQIYEDISSVVGYLPRKGMWVAAGLPVGPLSSLALAMSAFEHEAARAGCAVCYFGVEEADYNMAPKGILKGARIQIGAQPIWNPAQWPESVQKHSSLRRQIYRARNKGVVVQESFSASSAPALYLEECLEQWLERHPLPPMHFLAETDILNHLRNRRVFVAEWQERIVAFLVAVPIARKNGWLVEHIVRGKGAPNGTSELLVDAFQQAVGSEGALFVTLGLTPLAKRADRDQEEPALIRFLLNWARAHGRRFYNFDGIERFRVRMAPQRWENVYMLLNASRWTPLELLSVASAFCGETFSAYFLRALGRAVVLELHRRK